MANASSALRPAATSPVSIRTEDIESKQRSWNANASKATAAEWLATLAVRERPPTSLPNDPSRVCKGCLAAGGDAFWPLLGVEFTVAAWGAELGGVDVGNRTAGVRAWTWPCEDIFVVGISLRRGGEEEELLRLWSWNACGQ